MVAIGRMFYKEANLTTAEETTAEETTAETTTAERNGGGGDASALEGSWSIAAEAGALGVGPAQGDISWWSNSEEEWTEEHCSYDDEFVFGADGSFANVMGELLG